MAQRRIEVIFVLWDDLKLTSGLRNPTAFNGRNYFKKTARSNVLDDYYNSYLKKVSPILTLKYRYTTDPLKTLTFALF
jgi:hypothetical protein